MIFYGDRARIADEFERWAQERGAQSCPLNVVTFLMSRGLLDEERAVEYLKELEAEDNDEHQG